MVLSIVWIPPPVLHQSRRHDLRFQAVAWVLCAMASPVHPPGGAAIRRLPSEQLWRRLSEREAWSGLSQMETSIVWPPSPLHSETLRQGYVKKEWLSERALHLPARLQHIALACVLQPKHCGWRR